MTDDRRTGFGKKAKRRKKLLALADVFPEEADDYAAQAAALEALLREAGCCIACGRELSPDQRNTEHGMGTDCLKSANSK